MKRTALPLLLLLSLTISLFGQSDSVPKKFSITPLPILISDPFIGFGYGVLANANFLLGDAKTTRFSNAQMYGMRTTKGQFAVQINHTIFTRDENWVMQGKVQYLDWPENTYGLGARSSGEPPIKERISYKALELEQAALKKAGRKNFAGLQYRLYSCYDLKSEQPDSISFFEKNNSGTGSFLSSSIGLRFIHDSRDNVQNAFSGNYLELTVSPNLKALGSTESWTNVRLDLRTYRMLNKNVNHAKVIAARGMYEQAIGDVPYMIMPMTGRYYTTRGYVQGRFRGKTFISFETEYRAHIWKALGYVLFAGAHTLSEPAGGFKYVNPSAGGGLRVMLNKQQRTNLRVDYAVGIKGEGGLYLQVTEAF